MFSFQAGGREVTSMSGSPKFVAALVLAALLIGSAMEGRAASNKTRRGRTPDTSPAIGAEAPDFELVTVKWLMMSDTERAAAESKLKNQAPAVAATGAQVEKPAAGPGTVRLSSFEGKKPVLFVLTSYT